MKRGDFALKSAKVTGSGGLTAKFTQIEPDGSHTDITIERSAVVHPDLSEALKALRVHVLQIAGFGKVLKIANPKISAAKANEALEAFVDHATVSGISFFGEDESRGVVIMGSLSTFNNSATAYNTQRMIFAQDGYGHESEVELCCDEIEREVYEYLFENKQAQGELAFPEQGNGQVAEAV